MLHGPGSSPTRPWGPRLEAPGSSTRVGWLGAAPLVAAGADRCLGPSPGRVFAIVGCKAGRPAHSRRRWRQCHGHIRGHRVPHRGGFPIPGSTLRGRAHALSLHRRSFAAREPRHRDSLAPPNPSLSAPAKTQGGRQCTVVVASSPRLPAAPGPSRAARGLVKAPVPSQAPTRPGPSWAILEALAAGGSVACRTRVSLRTRAQLVDHALTTYESVEVDGRGQAHRARRRQIDRGSGVAS